LGPAYHLWVALAILVFPVGILLAHSLALLGSWVTVRVEVVFFFPEATAGVPLQVWISHCRRVIFIVFMAGEAWHGLQLQLSCDGLLHVHLHELGALLDVSGKGLEQGQDGWIIVIGHD
jgi:hypothetical protein